MAGQNKRPNNVGDRLWVKILCGILGILMVLGTFVYVFTSFDMNAVGSDNVRSQSSDEISVGIAYGNDLLPTYTVTAEGGFSVGIAVSNNKIETFDYDSKKISVAVCDNLYKSNLGYEHNPDRITAIGGYQLQLSSYSFKTGADVSGDNPVSFFPGATSGAGSGAVAGYTKSAVLEKIKDLDDSGILEQNNVYAYPVYSDGQYFIRIGDFSTEEELETIKDALSDKLSMVYTVIKPNDGSVSVIDYEKDRILMSFLNNEGRPLSVRPKESDSFVITKADKVKIIHRKGIDFPVKVDFTTEKTSA